VDLTRMFDGAAALAAGRPLAELLGPPETVLEVEVPFNRPDGLGIIGLAREVRAACGGEWTAVARERLAAGWKGDGAFDLKLEDAEGCPRYIAQAIEGVTIGPSPSWLVRRLESVGQRPINQVVDVTNYVLFEFGQPLHAFDLDRLSGPAIRVRRARAGERMTTLDGKERALDPEVLLITDAKGPVAAAGVMGGADSEVHDGSTRLLLECAWFDPRRIRRGGRALGLSTEASKRFERGVDPRIGRPATARFIELLRAITPGLSLGAGTERVAVEVTPRRLSLRPSRASRLVGLPFDAATCVKHLEAFEFGVEPGDPIAVEVPTWRADVTIEDDLVEEVARAEGYDRIPDVPLETGGVHAARSPRERLIARARAAMLARGFSEAWCSTLVSEREAQAAAEVTAETRAFARLVNPMSREGEVLRPNLVPGLLRAVAHNLRQGARAVRLFEIGSGFAVDAPGALPDETLMLGAVVTGQRYAHAHDALQSEVDFEESKGLWEAWLEEMRVDTPQWRSYAAGGWKPGASAEVASRASRIAWAGILAPSLLRTWEIEVPVHLFLALLEPVAERITPPTTVLPGRFPPVRRDLAFFVPERVTHDALVEALVRSGGEWLRAVELFDVYSGPGTPEGMKGLAFALAFEHPERTLKESEVQDIQNRMVTAVAETCGGRLRER